MQQKDNTKLFQIIKGSIAGVIFLTVIVLISALILYNNNFSDKFYIPLLSLSSALSGLISGFTSTRKLRKNGLVNGIISATIPALILLTAMIIANGSFNLFLIIPISMMLFMGAAGGIIAVNIKRKNKRK